MRWEKDIVLPLAAGGGAFVLLISLYELAGFWGAVVALGLTLIFLGLRGLRPR